MIEPSQPSEVAGQVAPAAEVMPAAGVAPAALRVLPPPPRVPNLLHVALLLTFAVLSFLLVELVFIAGSATPLLITLHNDREQLVAQVFAEALTLMAAWFLFPLLWDRSFLKGISWNAAAASPWLMLFGLLLGFVNQAVESLLPIPKNLPLDKLFHSSELVWFLAFLAVVVAPVFEEILFRGFLLPAIALAVDWLRLPRTLDALDLWRRDDGFSTSAIVIASLLTSVAFALIHAPQLDFTWPSVMLLGAVSLVLCLVRLRTRSVAASALVHSCYNLSVFITLYLVTAGFQHLERAS
jgi:membrane protease YdiL (CAAX protease family)